MWRVQKGGTSCKARSAPTPRRLLEATSRKIALAVRAGGLIPELRALRLKEIAKQVTEEFGGDLRTALTGSLFEARKTLKKFPGIADPGADRILLFAGIKPIAAVPSNCTQVLVRILYGREGESYNVNYRQGQQAISADVPETFEARSRAYLLLKHHGQEICKRSSPKCEKCNVNSTCAFFAAITATAR